MIKRFWEAEIGVEPLNPVPTLYTRVQRWKQITLLPGRLDWLDSMVFRGMKSMPVAVST